MKLTLITAFACFLFQFVLLNNSFASAPDSAGVSTINGKRYLIHKVEAKEGWMSIARRYNLPMEQVKQANPGIEALKIGQLVNIPVINAKNEKQVEKAHAKQAGEIQIKNKEIETPAILEKIEPKPAEDKFAEDKYKTPLKHTVKSGETLFSVSKKFNVSLNDIRTWNNMNDNSIQLGQELIVGYVLRYNNGKKEAVEINENEIYASAGEVKKSRKELRKERKEAKEKENEPDQTESEKEKTESLPAANAWGSNPVAVVKSEEIPVAIKNTNATAATPKPSTEAVKKAIPMIEKGVASWIDDNDINPSKFYALHRTAPSGTIIKVTNRMNNKHVFVKVVGILPDTGDNSNITIKLSKAAAMKLDVIDARFQAELTYNLYE